MRETQEDNWVLESGLTCAYDGEPVEYTDGVVYVMVVRPYVVEGRTFFYDVETEDKDDYLYEPVLFHAKNWEDINEQFETYAARRAPVYVADPLLSCAYCKSGIRQGETMGVAAGGQLERSQRNPDLKPYSNHFENLDRSPTVICISCLMDMNKDVHELWPDGVAHQDECEAGTYARCWRQGCSGNCVEKTR